MSFAWGVGVTWVVQPMNDRWLIAYGLASLVTVGAPIIEEIAKGLLLPVVLRARRGLWFVDGAVLGLASGTGFAIRENLVYLQDSSQGDAVGLAFARVSSTNLMHAGCAAVIGVALAATARHRGGFRLLVCVGSLGVAIGLHSTFNRFTDSSGSALVVTMVGAGVFVAAVGIISLGIPVSARWARREMSDRGLSSGEQVALAGGHSVDDLLDEFERRFGSPAATLAEQLIAAQRAIGIAAHGGRVDPARVQALTLEADQIRLRIGVFPMMWLRSHLPSSATSEGVWADLTPLVDDAPSNGVASLPPGGLWAAIDLGAPDEPT